MCYYVCSFDFHSAKVVRSIMYQYCRREIAEVLQELGKARNFEYN